MDWNGISKRIASGFEKYKYVICVIILGLLLMMIPQKETGSNNPQQAVNATAEVSVTEELSGILSQIRGVGRVRVMLTEQSARETVYQIDEEETNDTDRRSVRRETVLVSGNNGESGLVKTVNPPIYLGAIVVCQGADDPTVRLNVAKAVSAVTGISTDRITVLRMK